MKNCKSRYYIDLLVVCVSYPRECGNHRNPHGDNGKKASYHDRRMVVHMVHKYQRHAKDEPQKA